MIVMFRRINFYSICFAFGLSILIILAGSRYTDNMNNYRAYSQNHGNIRNVLRAEDAEDNNFVDPLPTNSYDGSPDIEKILENTRLKIKFELNNYNLNNSGVKELKELVMESGGQPVRSLIISTWRSGTTFLGEILNALPGNFYHYEPLLKGGITQIRGPPQEDQALRDIESMLKCDFNDMYDYFEYGKGHLHQFTHNTRLWDHCRYKKELCFIPTFTSDFCKLFPFQSMKIVRVRLRLLQRILENTILKVKILLLVRDPRGVMQSRQHRKFCKLARDCWHAELLCADMINDYVAAARLMKKFPNRVMVLRYEELALDPKSTTHRIFQFLGLNCDPAVEDYLNAHTNVEVAGVSSTFRVSHEVPFKWKNILDFKYVYDIQEQCKEAMNLWGYKMVYNSSHMMSDDFYPLEPYSVTL